MQASMKEAYHITSRKSDQRKATDRIRRSTNAIMQKLEIGDRVLIRNVREKGGPGKLRSFWEQEIYTIVDCKGDSGVVYSVRQENNEKGRIRTVHRIMLLPYEHLSSENTEINRVQKRDKEIEKEWKNKGKVIRDKNRTNVSSGNTIENLCDDQEDFEGDFEGFHPNLLNQLTNPSEENTGTLEERTDSEPVGEIRDSVFETSDENTEVHNERPQRERRPPQFLNYYGHGQSFDSCAGDISSINITSQRLPGERLNYYSYPNAYTGPHQTPLFVDQAYFRANPINFNFSPPFMYPILPVQYQHCF